MLSVAVLAGCVASMAQAQPDDAALRAAREAVAADEAARIEHFDRAAKSVVCIFAELEQQGGGSGVIIDPDGYGLTNFHVVADIAESRKGWGALDDGKLYPLTVLGIDPGGDLAMFKLDGLPAFHHAPLGDASELVVGQWVAAMGNPFLLAEDYRPTITLGIVAGLHRYQGGEGNLLEYADCIQVSTSINPGNSGGPLFDLSGRLMGINGRASFEERGRVNVGLGYAITINQARRFIPGLRAGGIVYHGNAGMTVQRSGDRLIINKIQDFSAAEQAGLKPGDELLTVAGRPVQTPNDYNNVVTTMPAGWPVVFRVRRGGETFDLTVRLDRMPLAQEMPFAANLAQNQREAELCFRRCYANDLRGERPDEVDGWRIVLQPEDSAAKTLTLSGDAEETLPKTAIEEFALLAPPLLTMPEIGLRWRLEGGDELDGRIVYVVAQDVGEKTVARWLFDLDTDRLIAAAIGDRDAPYRGLWRPGERQLFNGLLWPKTWTREADGARQAFAVQELEPQQPPASQPIAAPASQPTSRPASQPATDAAEATP